MPLGNGLRFIGRLHDVVGKLLCAVEIANRGEKDIKVFGIGLPYPIDRIAIRQGFAEVVCRVALVGSVANDLGCSLIPGQGSSSPRTSLPGSGFSPR